MRLRTILALVLIAPTPFAAQQHAAAPTSPATAPPRTAGLGHGEVSNHRFVHYDARTGKIIVDSRGPVQARGSGTVVTLDNLSGSVLYYSTDGNIGEEFVHLVTNERSSESGVVPSIRMDYVSRAQDPASGGPGAAIEVSLQRGFSALSPTQSSHEVMRESISGLPTGNATQLTGMPSLTVWTLTITASSPACLGAVTTPDGYSFKHIDSDTFPVIRATVPSSIGLPADYQVHDCSGNWSGTDLWGVGESIGIEITEFVRNVPTVIGTSPSPANGELSTQGSGGANVGNAFVERLSCSGAGPLGFSVYLVHLGPALSTPVSSKWGDIWLDLAQPRVIKLLAPHFGAFSDFDLGMIPLDYGLLGTVFTSQGFCSDYSPQGISSNALQHTIGAYCD